VLALDGAAALEALGLRRREAQRVPEARRRLDADARLVDGRARQGGRRRRGRGRLEGGRGAREEGEDNLLLRWGAGLSFSLG
jgi:hypothetical protein